MAKMMVTMFIIYFITVVAKFPIVLTYERANTGGEPANQYYITEDIIADKI
jgi:hypothetical protein